MPNDIMEGVNGEETSQVTNMSSVTKDFESGGLGNNFVQNFVIIKSVLVILIFVSLLCIQAKNCFILVNLVENQKRKDYLSWDEYFMSAAFLTAMRSKVKVSLLTYEIVYFTFLKRKIYALLSNI